MKIELPKWIKETIKWTLAIPVTIAGLWVAQNFTPEQRQTMLNESVQIYMTADSIMTIKDGDTTRELLTDAALGRVYRVWNGNLYDNGYVQHVIDYKTIDLLTGEVYPQYFITAIRPVGTQFNMKLRMGKSELASEKIAERLETLPVGKAEELGYAKLIDTVEVAKDVVELKPRWTKDKDAKAEYVPSAKPKEE